MENLWVYNSGGGISSYDPKMMLKVWIYGYCERIYASRRLAMAMKVHVVFMWLRGAQTWYFETLSAFRRSRCRMYETLFVLLKNPVILCTDIIFADFAK